MQGTIDIKKLKQEIHETVKEIREHKAVTRKPHLNLSEVSKSQMALEWLKAKATRLCALRAHHRGKVHRHNMTLEEQERWLREKNVVAKFLIREETFQEQLSA